MASEIANFAICRRLADGTFDQFEPNTSEYTFVASSISIALRMMTTSKVFKCLTDIAIQYDAAQTDTWYEKLDYDEYRASELVAAFLAKVQAQFPVIAIDYQIINKDFLGYHPRGEWNHRYGEFEPRSQAVFLNGPLVSDMVRSVDSGERFRNFQFLFANTFLHEVGGHLLITYLNEGQSITPASIAGHWVYSSTPFGEAGRALESKVFGGNLEYYRSLKEDDHQAGVPHVLHANGEAFRITRKTIDDTVAYRFGFPYETVTNATKLSNMISMGRLDANMPNPATALHRNMIAQSASKGYQVRIDLGSPVCRVPFDHAIRVEAI